MGKKHLLVGLDPSIHKYSQTNMLALPKENETGYLETENDFKVDNQQPPMFTYHVS